MEKYLFLCVVLLNMILISKAWPPATGDSLYFPKRTAQFNRQGYFQKREVSTANPRKDKMNDDIIFPDVTPPSEGDFSASGKGVDCIEGVCSGAKEYPFKQIEEILSRTNLYNEIFGHTEGAVVNTTSRFQPGQESETLCATTVHTKYPKVLKNENDTEKFIVNVGNHTQGLIFETCVEKAKCQFQELFPSDYVSECTQRFAKRRLMALSDDGKTTAFDTFVVPSCCVCTIRKVKTK